MPTTSEPVLPQQGLPRAECFESELDVFEGFGNIQYGGTRTDDFFSGALHRNTGEYYGEPNQFAASRSVPASSCPSGTSTPPSGPPTVSYYVDGPTARVGKHLRLDLQPMHLLLYNWNTAWEDENMPNASTPAQLDVSVDWVRVWQQ